MASVVQVVDTFAVACIQTPGPQAAGEADVLGILPSGPQVPAHNHSGASQVPALQGSQAAMYPMGT